MPVEGFVVRPAEYHGVHAGELDEREELLPGGGHVAGGDPGAQLEEHEHAVPVREYVRHRSAGLHLDAQVKVIGKFQPGRVRPASFCPQFRGVPFPQCRQLLVIHGHASRSLSLPSGGGESGRSTLSRPARDGTDRGHAGARRGPCRDRAVHSSSNGAELGYGPAVRSTAATRSSCHTAEPARRHRWPRTSAVP